MSSSKRARQGRNRQRAKARRDAYTAGRDLTVINQSWPGELAAFQAAAAPVVVAQLPAVVAGFTGRDDELALVAGLLDRSVSPALVVSGLAGVGKTTFAVHVAHSARDRGLFPGGVLFIDLHGYDDVPVEPVQALDELLRALGVADEHIPPGTEARAALYRSVLAQVREPVLVMADNASSEAQVRPLLPGSGPHRVIVTSRHILGGLEARLLDLMVLDTAASVALVDSALRLARPDDDRITGDPVAAARLAGICAGLPLALQIVAALLKSDPGQQVGELAEEIEVERVRLERLRYNDGSGVREPSVAAAFEMSYRLLGEAAARMFRLVPLSPGPDISTEAAAILADVPVTNARNTLADLARAHLLERSPAAAGRWQMHDLLRLYARRLSQAGAGAPAARKARDRLFSYYVHVTRAAVMHLLALPGVNVSDEFTGRDDALAWLNAERPNLVLAVGVAAHLRKAQVTFELSVVLVEYLSWRRYVREWVATATAGFRAARALGDQAEEAGALNNLGLALRAARRFDEAAAAHRGAAAISQQLGDRRKEGMALHNLGLVLDEQRLFGEAIAAYEQDLAICREFGDDRGEAMTLNSASLCFMEAGRLAEALAACRGAARIFRKLGDRHNEGMALNNLSTVLTTTGMLDQAITANQGAQNIFRETSDPYNEAMALLSFGRAMYQAQRFDEVINASKDAAAIFREIGDRHGEGLAVSNLAGGLLQAHRLDEAIAIDQDALAIFRETEDRFNEGMAYNNLGLALHRAGSLDAAIIAHQHAIAIFRDIGRRKPESMTLNNLADSLRGANRLDEAEEASQAADAIAQETDLGQRGPQDQ